MSISFAATPQAKEGQQTRAYTDDVSAGAPPSRRTGYDRPYVNRDHWNKVFTQPEYFDSIAKQKGMVEGAKVSLHGDDYVYRQAMMGYLSATRNVPLDDMRSVFDAEKDGFAQKVLGKKTATARELFDWHKTKFERENEKSDAARTVIEDVTRNSLQDAMMGGDTPFVQSVAKSIEATGDLFTEEEKSRLWEKAEEQDKQIRATQAAVAPEARFLFSALGQITGQQAGMGAPDMREVAGKFAQLPDNQRKAIYELAGGFAQLQKTDKGFWYQLAESLGRGTAAFTEGIPRNFREQTLRGQLRLLESEQPVFRATGVAGAEFSAAGNEPVFGATQGQMVTPEEREQAKSKIQSDLGVLKVERELRDLAERVIDPIKTVTFLPEIVEEGLYGAAQSIPYTVAAAIPYVGMPAVASALFSANYDSIMLQYDGIDPDKAALIAAISAPIEAGLERMKVNTLMGRTPIVAGLFKRLQHPNQRNLTRILIGSGAIVAEQNVQEVLQNATFPLIQTVAAALDQDMPNYDWAKRIEGMPRELAVQFVALLPLSLMGIGALSHREISRGESYIRNKSNLERMGYGEDQIDRITGAATADEAQTILQDEHGKRDPEAVKAAAKRVLDEVLALREQKAPASLPRLEKQGADYVVLQPDGTVITRSTDQTVAEQALVSARRETVQREMRDVHTGINEAVEFIQKVNEARQRGEDVAEVIREQSPRTLLTDYEANPTQENLDRLYETVRAFGQDINEPAELANFPVIGSNQGALAEGIWRSVIRINEGADGTIVMREFAQDNLKRAISEGRTTMDFVRQQLNDVLPQIDSSRIKRQLRTDTDTDVIEAFSDVALAYFRGSIREEQIPAGLRGIMRRLAIISRDIFRRAYNLARLRAEGKLDRDFEALLAEAVGVNQQALVDRARERTEQEVGAAENYSIGIPPAMDTDYLAAVERGDMEMAQRMVDEAARAAGYDIGPVFHGTNREFNKFSKKVFANFRNAQSKIGFFFTPDKSYAQQYASPEKEESAGRIVSAYLRGKFKEEPRSLIEEIESEWTNQKAGSYVARLKREGFDGVIFDGSTKEIAVFNPNQIKSADPVTYDASGNVIPLSQRFDATTADINYSIGLQSFKDWFGDWENDPANASKVVGPDGNPLVVYHGTQRPDRIGSRFRKSRATSGPMAFFTAVADIASSYAKGKSDTSLELPSDYSGWFKYKGKGMRSAVDIDRAWWSLSEDERETIRQRIYTVGYENADEASGPIVGNSSSIMGRDSIDYELRQARGNALRALVETWLTSGSLFNREEEFMQVLEAAGMDMGRVTYDSPFAVRSAVYPVYLSIKNPLNTSNITADVFAALEQAGKRKRAKRSAGGNADSWDKNTISGKDWLEAVRNDVETGSTMAWTRIPDWATDTLAALGYDGIHDVGGKYGGEKHDVWIPFEETQVKSATGNRGTFDPNNPRIDYSIATSGEMRDDRGMLPIKRGDQIVQIGHWGDGPHEQAPDQTASIYVSTPLLLKALGKKQGTAMNEATGYIESRIRAVDLGISEGTRSSKESSRSRGYVRADDAAGIAQAIDLFKSQMLAYVERVVAQDEKYGHARGVRHNYYKSLISKGPSGIDVVSIELTGEGGTNVLGPYQAPDNYSISTQSEIDRVQAAMGALDRSPLSRLKVYEKMQERFLRVMSDNRETLAAMEGGDLSQVRRTQILQALGELDGIISALPTEIRAKIGGYTQLAKVDPMDVFKGDQKVSEVRGMSGAIISAWMREGLNIGQAQKKTELPAGYRADRNLDPTRADRAIADVFIQRINRINEALEKFLRDEYNDAAVELFKRAKPQRSGAGEKPKGKLGANVHELFDTLKEATEWSAEKAQAWADGQWARIESGELNPYEQAHATLAAQVVPLFADWANADSTQRAAAVSMGKDILDRAYKGEQQRIIAQRTKRGYDRTDLSKDAGVSAQDDKARQNAVKRENSLPAKWEAAMLNLLNFDQVLRYVFGNDSKIAQKISDRQRKADNVKSDDIAALSDDWASLLTRLGGGEMQGQQLLFDLSRMDEEIDGVSYSQNQLVAITMMWMQPKGRQHMEGFMDSDGQPAGKWHYNQAFVNKAEKLLRPESKAIREYLLLKYDQEYEAINKVYRKVYGLNLPKNQFYSPLIVESINAPAQAGIDPVTGGVFAAGANSPSALRSRGGAIAQPVFRDAVQTYFGHMLQMAHWKAYAEFNGEVSALLGHRDTRNVVKGKAGEQAATVMNNWLQYFQQGGNKDAANHLAINQMINRITGNFAVMALFGRVSTLALQVTQLGAASAKMPVGAYLSRFGKLMSGNLNWKAALDSDYIQRRIKDMPPAVALAMQGLRSDKPSVIREASRRLGQLISGFDGFFTAGTYAIVYDYQLTQAQKNGMGGQEAADYAREATERIVDEIAQPTRAGARSIYELNSTNPVARAVWAFSSEARKNLGLALYAGAKGRSGDFGKAVFYVLILNGLVSTVIRSAFRDLRDDDDDEIFDEKNWGWNRMAAMLISDPLYGFPVVGEAIESGIFNAFGVYTPSGPLFDVAPAVPAVKRILTQYPMEVLEGEAEYRDILRDVNRILSTAGLFNSTIAGAASLTNLAKDSFEVGDNLLGDDE